MLGVFLRNDSQIADLIFRIHGKILKGVLVVFSDLIGREACGHDGLWLWKGLLVSRWEDRTQSREEKSEVSFDSKKNNSFCGERLAGSVY